MSASSTDWLQYAEDDLAMARVLITSTVPPRGAAFHAQQSVEKALKAILVSHSLVVPRVHDLLALVYRLPTVDGLPSIAELDLLSDYAVESRYPDDLPDIDDEQAATEIELAEVVLRAAREALRSSR